MQISRRLERRFECLNHRRNDGRVGPTTVQCGFGPRHAMRPLAGADDADVGVARRAIGTEVIERGDAGERKVATALRELLEGPAPLARPWRQTQLDDQLVIRQRRRKRAGKEVAGADGARAFWPSGHDLSIASDRDTGQLGRRIGVREAAADRAAIADLVVRDVLHRCHQQRLRGLEALVVLDVAPAHARAEPHAICADRDAGELVQLAEIHEQRWRAEAKGERRDQALAARERLGSGVGGEEAQRLGKRCRCCIVEARQLHCSGRMPAIFTTLSQRAMSARWKAASSSGLLPIGVVPRPLRRSRKSVCVTALWISLASLSVTSCGMPAGPKIAYHDVTSNPWYPASATVGRSMPGTRSRVASASALSLPFFPCCLAAVYSTGVKSMFPAIRSASAGPEPLYGTCTAWMPVSDLKSSAAR